MKCLAIIRAQWQLQMWVYSAVWGSGAAEREWLESAGAGHLHSAIRDKFALFRI